MDAAEDEYIATMRAYLKALEEKEAKEEAEAKLRYDARVKVEAEIRAKYRELDSTCPEYDIYEYEYFRKTMSEVFVKTTNNEDSVNESALLKVLLCLQRYQDLEDKTHLFNVLVLCMNAYRVSLMESSTDDQKKAFRKIVTAVSLYYEFANCGDVFEKETHKRLWQKIKVG